MNLFPSLASPKASLLAAAVVCLSIAGTAAAEEAKGLPESAAWYVAYLRDSHLVPIPDGRSLNLYCVGSGSPTIVLESGLGGGAYDWRAVQGKMAKLTRVCAYDRAGMGRSPMGPLPRDTKADVADLEALLKAADIRPPYLLVGHSMGGGYNLRLFASRHLEDVAGIVLVDPSVENQVAVMEKALPAGAESDKKSIAFARSCAVPNPSAEVVSNCTRAAPKDFPPDLAAAWLAGQGPALFQTFDSEIESFLNVNSREVLAESRQWGATPLIILTRGERSTNMPVDQAQLEWTIWNGMHDKLKTLSTVGINRVVPGANHYIQLDKPDVVVDAVTEVLAAARQRPPRHN